MFFLSDFTDFLIKNWIQILLIILIVLILFLLCAFLYFNFYHKEKSFKDNFKEIKSSNIAVTIDFQERIVEQYYLYDQNYKYKTMSLDEFYIRFDKQNEDKLKKWLEKIESRPLLDKIHRIELVMYDNANTRGVYFVEIEGYNAENKRFFLHFIDVTESREVFRRIEKKYILKDSEEFYRKANERLSVTDDNSNNYLVAINFKEHSFAKKELKTNLLELIEEQIYYKVLEYISDNELLCSTANGTILLFSPNIVNIKKYKLHIRAIILKCSGKYYFPQNKLEYTITLVAGYTKINKNEILNIDKTLEAETAMNAIISKGRFSDKVQLFDDHLKNAYNVMNNKLLAVEKVIVENLFSIVYEPIINTKSKTVSGYYIKVILPQALNMNFNEFMALVKQRFFRVPFYTKIFQKVLTHKDARKKPFYLSFDYDNLTRVVEAYNQNLEFANIKFYFCLEFSSTTMQNTNLLSIEKKLNSYQSKYSIKLGITYNSLNTIYLNAKIYSQASVVLLMGQLVDKSLDKYSNANLLDTYINIANEYKHEVIGLSVKSLAIYELFAHYKIKKVGGNYLRPYASEGKIVDKSLLKNLNEIESKDY